MVKTGAMICNKTQEEKAEDIKNGSGRDTAPERDNRPGNREEIKFAE